MKVHVSTICKTCYHDNGEFVFDRQEFEELKKEQYTIEFLCSVCKQVTIINIKEP